MNLSVNPLEISIDNNKTLNPYNLSNPSKNLSEWDLESFKLIEYFSHKSWFNSKIVLLYYSTHSFTLEVIKKSWFKEDSVQYPNLSWIEAFNLFKKETQK